MSLWDSRDLVLTPPEYACPPGEVCCGNIPCQKYDGGNAFECVRGGGGSVDGGTLTPKNCSWSDDTSQCRCTPPLVNAGFGIGDFNVENPAKDCRAPFDCVCSFTTVEQWLRLDVCNPPGVSKLGIKLTKGSLASSLADDGLVNATVTKDAKSVPVEIQLNGTMFAKTQPQIYTAKQGKSGSAKDPK